jgi:hypothetical protein
LHELGTACGDRPPASFLKTAADSYQAAHSCVPQATHESTRLQALALGCRSLASPFSGILDFPTVLNFLRF